MKLTLKDRIMMPTLLPKEGKFETLIILADIQKKLAITQKELEKYEIKSEGNSISWNAEGANTSFPIDFTESETNVIGDIFKKLSSEEKLSVDLLELYKLFVN